MATCQRLRAVLEARRASQPCWRCALNLPRYSSTRASKSVDANAISYDEILQREIYQMLKSLIPRIRLESTPRSATESRSVDESARGSSQTVRKPRIRVARDGQQVPLVTRTLSKSKRLVRRLPSDSIKERRRAVLATVRKPRIRVAMDGQQVPLVTRTLPERWRIVPKTGIRAAIEGQPVPLVPRTMPGKGRIVPKPRTRVPIRGQRKARSSSQSEHDDLAPSIRRLYTSENRITHRLRAIFAAKRLPSESNLGDNAEAETKSAAIHKIRRVQSEKSENSTTGKDTSRPEVTNSQKAKSFRIVIARFRQFLAEKLGARVRLASKPIIKQYIDDDSNAPKLYFHQNYNDSLGIIQKLWKDFPQNKETSIFAAVDDNPRLVRTTGPPLGERSTDARGKQSKRNDEVSHDVLMSLLDEFQDLLPSKPPLIAAETGNMTSYTRSSLQYSRHSPRYLHSALKYSAWRPLLGGSRASNRQNLDTSQMSFSTRATSRQYATAATVQADAPIDPSITGMNPDDPVKGKSGGIRNALKLWQERHDIALANRSGEPPSSTLGDTQNLVIQSGEDDSFTAITRDDEVDDEDDVEFQPEEPTPDIFAHQVFLRRGDLVELVAASEPILAIFVRNVADQCQFYTIRGEWVNREPTGARWAVSRFVDPDDLNEILPYLPAVEVAVERMNRLLPVDVHAPRDAGAKVIEQMSLFHQAADAVFRSHAEKINRLYDIIAPSEGSTDRTYMSLKEITMKVLMKEDLSEPTQPMMWAIHRAIAQCQNITWDKMNYRQNPTYAIYPRQGLKYIHQVREWVREYQEGITQETTNQPTFSDDSTLIASTRSLNPIATFVRKARSAIRQSRRTRSFSKSGFVGPSLTRLDMEQNCGEPYREINLQKFDQNDKLIIHYLDVWANSSYINAYTNLESLGPMILRAIGMYEGFELNQSRGFTLLQELGVVTPWENKTVHKLKGLRLPGHDGGFGEVSLTFLEARTENKCFEPKDSMEALRRDWGDMPVFCIDSAETMERDDGVSLELDDNDPSAYWVHVHVANPSAFITPDSAMAKYAALLAESVYFPERKYPMLDPGLTKDRLGLAENRPCITFSAKISADGDMLEKKITPGIVRNVHYLTPQVVGQGLGLTETVEESETLSILTVGGRMPTRHVDDLDRNSRALTDAGHIKALRKLLELGEAARHKRARAGAPDFYSSARIASSYPIVYAAKFADKYSMIENKHVRQFEGDPIITLQRTTESYGLVAKMVSDLMIIAGDVGASWCSERNIPIPYRGILRNPEPASSPEAFKREVLGPKIAKYGHAEQADLRRYMRLVGQAQASDRPLPHLTLGLPAYCKTTSPLRRYIDLYAHWQIEAAIRHEAATGTSLVGSTDGSYLPFSRAQVEEFAAGALHRERTISLAKTSSTRHWICQALFRAFYFKEATLPETFEVRTVDGWVGHGLYPGWSNLLNVKVRLMQCAAVTSEGGWRVGDVWEARLDAVDPYYMTIQMEPVRLLEREGE